MALLTDKEQNYCYWRARGHGVGESVVKALYKGKGKDWASKYGWKLEQKAKIKEYTEMERVKLFEKVELNEEFVLEGLKKIAVNGQIEANRVRAYELLGKTKAMFTDKFTGSVQVTQTEAEKQELEVLRGRVLNPIAITN